MTTTERAAIGLNILKETTAMTTSTHVQAMHSGQALHGFGTLFRRIFFTALAALCLPSVASAQTANLWIDTNGGSCTRQSSAATYNDAAACASIQAAVSACVPGDTIRMKSGNYGGQTITAVKTAPGCTVIAEPATTTGLLTTHGAWYEIQNITANVNTGWFITGTASNITCRNCSFSGVNTSVFGYQDAAVYWGGKTSNISWIGGSLTNFSCSSCAKGMAVYGSTNMLVDGVTFDGVRNTGGLGNHFEVIRVDGNVNGLTIRNSTFGNNNETSTSTIFFSTWTGTKPQNILFENNFFGSPGSAYYVFQMNFQNLGSCANWTFRYNTFVPGKAGVLIDPASGSCSGGFSNVIWVGNLAPRGNCQGTAFRSNVWYGSSGAACGGTDKVVASAGFGSDGFRLAAGSLAIDAGGTGTDCIASDHDGNARPSGGRCDAGASEYGAAAQLAPPQNLVVQ